VWKREGCGSGKGVEAGRVWKRDYQIFETAPVPTTTNKPTTFWLEKLINRPMKVYAWPLVAIILGSCVLRRFLGIISEL
jgi:hypothetical protein